MGRGELQLGAFLVLALLFVVAIGLATKATITGNVVSGTTCSPAETSVCENYALYTCTGGMWTYSFQCPYGCSSDLKSCAGTSGTTSCTSGSTKCDTAVLYYCSAGTWTYQSQCPNGCSGDGLRCAGSITVCTVGEKYCDQNNNAWRCTSTGWTNTYCQYGCQEGICCTQEGCSSVWCTPGETRSCFTDAGTTDICDHGTQTCGAGGAWGDCLSQTVAAGETCNGLDDDCDRLVDEGVLCPDFKACLGTAGCQLLCSLGHSYCQSSQLTTCTLQTSGIYNWTNTTCAYGCANTTACNLVAPYCMDSDDGGTIGTKGTMYYLVNGIHANKTDYCVQQSVTVHEYYCDGTTGRAADIACPQGQTCQNGACVPLPSCTETDSGQDHYAKGRMEYVEENQWKNRTDTCLSTTTLHEYYCGSTVGMSIDIACEQGCISGACVNAAVVFCEETDAGRKYSTKGTTTYHESGQNMTRVDTCNDDGTLHEYYCDGAIGKTEDVACTAGATCADGACTVGAVQVMETQPPTACPADCVAYETNTTWRMIDNCRQTTFMNTTTYLPACANPLICTYESTTATGPETSGDAPDGTVCDGGLCVAGTCKQQCPYPVPGCQAQAPPNAIFQETYACISGACYSCAQNTVWDGGGCQDHGYTLTVEDIIAPAGSTLTITPSIVDAGGDAVDGVSYEVTGYRQSISAAGFALVTATTDVGRHQLLFTAKRPFGTGERTLAQRSIDLLLTCPEEHPCCAPGTTVFYPLGTSCSDGGQEGLCTAEGLCIPTGTSQEGSAYGNCDDRIDNDGDGVYDCIRQEGAYENECADACRNRFCEAPTSWCAEEQGARCADVSSDWKRCGSCENSCLEDQECQDGACVTIPGCVVICSEEQDCGEGETCYAPGTCGSYCESIPQIIMNATDQQTIISTIISEKTFTIEKRVEGQEIIIAITNLIGEPLTNFTMFVGIPPEYAISQGAISGPFTVESTTPLTLRIFLPEVGGTETVRLLFSRILAPTRIDDVLLSASHETVSASPLGTDALTISRTTETSESGTTIKLTLTSQAHLGDVRVPLEIPKCLAQSIGELKFDRQNYEVIQDDPLMVWTFDSLAGAEEISFTVPKAVSEDCEEQLKAFGLAGTRGRRVNPWLVLAIIPALGIFLVLVQRIREVKTEHLSKEEFTTIARGQGQNEEEIERAWRDYKRRF